MLGGFIADQIIPTQTLEKDAIAIEGTADSHGGGAAEEGPKFAEPVLGLIAAADAEKGGKIAKACAACHSFEKGGAVKQGPALWGIVNHAKGTASGFDYSEGLKAKGGDWDMASLNQFLKKPKKFVEGTKMNFAGVAKVQDRADLIAWMRQQADSPAADPSEADIAAEIELYAPKVEEHAAEAAPAEGEAAPAVDGEAAPAEEKAAEPAPAH